MQTSINSLIIMNINNEKEVTIALTKSNKQNALTNILHFDFVSTSPMMDFFLVESTGIRFYKIEEEKLHCKEIKYLPLTINFCWFEVFSLFFPPILHFFHIYLIISHFFIFS